MMLSLVNFNSFPDTFSLPIPGHLMMDVDLNRRVSIVHNTIQCLPHIVDCRQTNILTVCRKLIDNFRDLRKRIAHCFDDDGAC